MDETKNRCPKCESRMERGFVLDQNNVGGFPVDSSPRWVEGEPEQGGLGGLKIIGKRTYAVSRAERCARCGYVEFYTSSEVEYG